MDKWKKLKKIIERMIKEKELVSNYKKDDYSDGELAELKQIQNIMITIEMVERD